MDIRQTELHNATVQATYVRHFRTTPLGEVANMPGVLDFNLNLAQSCGTCSMAVGTPSSPVQHDGGRTSNLLRLLR
jgi:hypothetical protein